MSGPIDSFLALPTFAHVLVALAALTLAYRFLRTRVFKTTAAARADIEFDAWNAVLAPHGWVGKIERGMSTHDVNISFEHEAVGGTRTFRLFGEHGVGVMELLGIASEYRFEIDLEGAPEKGILEVLRVTHNAAKFADSLGHDGEVALLALPGYFIPGSCPHLEKKYMLAIAWSVPWDDTDDVQAVVIQDRAEFFDRVLTIERALLGSEPRELGPAELAELARSGGALAPTLAGRVLLGLHPASAPARALTEDLVAGRLGGDLTRWLSGCVFGDEAVSALGLTRDEHTARARAAVVRADESCGPALARAAIDAYGVDAFVGQGFASNGVYGDNCFEQLGRLKRRRTRDAHIFACHVIAAFRGSEDADAFEDAYARVVEDIEHDFEFATEFAAVMGELDAWYPQLIRRALAYPSHDDVYGFWAGALEVVWDATLASDLVTLLEGQAAEGGTLEARALVAIVEAATLHDHVRLLSRARDAYARIKKDWTSDEHDTQAMGEALQVLEARFMDVKREGTGQLSLSSGGDAGGLSLSNQGAEGDLEVVLDASDEHDAPAHAEARDPGE